jgi:hypothetical protein
MGRISINNPMGNGVYHKCIPLYIRIPFTCYSFIRFSRKQLTDLTWPLSLYLLFDLATAGNSLTAAHAWKPSSSVQIIHVLCQNFSNPIISGKETKDKVPKINHAIFFDRLAGKSLSPLIFVRKCKNHAKPWIGTNYKIKIILQILTKYAQKILRNIVKKFTEYVEMDSTKYYASKVSKKNDSSVHYFGSTPVEYFTINIPPYLSALIYRYLGYNIVITSGYYIDNLLIQVGAFIISKHNFIKLVLRN